MANELYGLQESQIKALGEAKWWALTIYGWLHKFFAGLTSNRPHWAVDAITKLLGYHDDNYPPKALATRLETIGFFIEPVRIPVTVPRFACRENVSVLSSDCASAHEGALTLWDNIRWLLQHEVLQLCPELGLAYSPRDAGLGLEPHCENLRRDLGDAIEYDLDGLADAIKRESQAAMELCNASLISAVAGPKEIAPTAAKAGQDERDGGAGKESVDARGEVTNPADSTAYVAANEVRLSHTPAGLVTGHKQLVSVLSDHPEIKRWHPRSNRLLIHLADWRAFVKRETEKRDADGLLTNPTETEARTAESRRKEFYWE